MTSFDCFLHKRKRFEFNLKRYQFEKKMEFGIIIGSTFLIFCVQDFKSFNKEFQSPRLPFNCISRLSHQAENISLLLDKVKKVLITYLIKHQLC